MARASKGARNITVGEVKYRWRATGNDGWISLTIWPSELPGPAIVGSFDYDQTLVPAGPGRYSGTRQVVVTSRLVRQVIELAVNRFGYEPEKAGRQLSLRQLDTMVDMSKALRSA